MDLRLYSRVLWRFRVIVLGGLLLASVLAFLSVAKVSLSGSPKVTYRQSETWDATALVFITQKGFPYGYSVPPTNSVTVPGTAGPTLVPKYASPGTFTQLANYYVPFVQSDAFNAMLRSRTRIAGAVNARTLSANGQSNSSLPYISITAAALTRGNAVTLANTAADVFSAYIVDQQNANAIPEAQRVQVQVISNAHAAVLAAGRKKTVPIVVFLTVLIAAIGLAFVLENMRPRIRQTASLDAAPDESLVTRRRPA